MKKNGHKFERELGELFGCVEGNKRKEWCNYILRNKLKQQSTKKRRERKFTHTKIHKTWPLTHQSSGADNMQNQLVLSVEHMPEVCTCTDCDRRACLGMSWEERATVNLSGCCCWCVDHTRAQHLGTGRVPGGTMSHQLVAAAVCAALMRGTDN